MKKIFYFGFLIIFTACQNNNSQPVKPQVSKEKEQVVQNISEKDPGYVLMQQYCMSCHVEKPSRANKENMIAPPMLRIQEHYKPVYPNETDFVNAIVNWVNKPNEKDVKMPGATRKFGIMPALPIGDDKLKSIARYLYRAKFEAMPHRGMGMQRATLSLNNGKKWQLEQKDAESIRQIKSRLQNMKSDKLADYQELGKQVFDRAKQLMLNKDYKGEKLTQIQAFFHTVEDDMHQLMKVNNIADARNLTAVLQSKFNKFSLFFE